MSGLAEIRGLLGPGWRQRLFVVSLATSLVLLGAVFALGDTAALGRALAGVRLPWLVAALVTLGVLNLTAALRLRYFLAPEPRPGFTAGCLDVTVLHALLLILLPARMGDVCYPFLLRHTFGAALPAAVANLVALRLHDLLVTVSLMLLALQLNASRLSRPDLLAQASTGLFVLAATVLLVLVLLPRFVRGHAAAGTRSGLAARLVQLFGHLRHALSEIAPWRHALSLAVTTLRWLLAAAVLYCLLHSVGLALDPAAVLLVSMGMNLAVALPLQTVGGFGLVESASAFFIALFGVPLPQAVAVALAARVLGLLAQGLLSAAWLLPRRRRVLGAA